MIDTFAAEFQIDTHLTYRGNPANLESAQIAVDEETGIITDLTTGETFQELIDWQIFTDMWMQSMWQMRRNSNHNKLAAIMRKVETMSGIDHPIQHYIDLALTCQHNYFAATTGKAVRS